MTDYQPQPAPATAYGPGGFVPPPIIINNVTSSSASAAAAVGLGVGRGRRRQSGAVHLVLFLTTAGVGNAAYALYVSSWNRRHGL